MLQPKRTKYRRTHRLRYDDRSAHKGDKVSFGEFGLQSKTGSWISARQIESARIAITRHMGREGQVFIRIFPHFALTSKPIGLRMGKGKGSPDKWVAVAKVNTMLFEVKGVSREVALEALRLGGHKLPVKVKIIEATSETSEAK